MQPSAAVFGVAVHVHLVHGGLHFTPGGVDGIRANLLHGAASFFSGLHSSGFSLCIVHKFHVFWFYIGTGNRRNASRQFRLPSAKVRKKATGTFSLLPVISFFPLFSSSFLQAFRYLCIDV